MSEKSPVLTADDRQRMFVFSVDPTAQQSSPARDEVLTLMGRALHDLALYESWLAQIAAVVLVKGAKHNIPRVDAQHPRGMGAAEAAILLIKELSAGSPAKRPAPPDESR
jgi:hypothetical protein